jgi:hypothetical protein
MTLTASSTSYTRAKVAPPLPGWHSIRRCGGHTPSTACPAHELVVGVDQSKDVGVLRLMTYDAVWYAAGKPRDDDQPISYQLLCDRQPFPPDALLRLDDVRAAIKDFLVNNRRRRPVGLAWTEWPETEPQRLARGPGRW